MRRVLPLASLVLVACGSVGAAVDPTETDSDTDTACVPEEEIPYDGIDQDCDFADLVDVDGDGFRGTEVWGDDCDDQDASIHPEAEEIPYDGVDQDCAGGDLVDVDRDGHDASEVGGPDCDDADASISPTGTEIPYDGIDQDCDGADLLDADGDGFDAAEVGGKDCDDADREVRPGRSEACNGIDDDCDGLVDDQLVGVHGATITETLREACRDHTVWVPEGTWRENVVWPVEPDVTLRGRGATPSDVVIDGGDCTKVRCSALYLSGSGPMGGHARVENLTLTGATETGLYAVDAYFIVADVIIRDNTGGGLHAHGSRWQEPPRVDGRLRSVQLLRNSSEIRGGGAFLDAPGGGSIDGCHFEGNHSDVTGGGADVYDGIPVTDTVFRNNSAVERGGGLFVHRAPDVADFADLTFEDNEAEFCPHLYGSFDALPSSVTFIGTTDEGSGCW